MSDKSVDMSCRNRSISPKRTDFGRVTKVTQRCTLHCVIFEAPRTNSAITIDIYKKNESGCQIENIDHSDKATTLNLYTSLYKILSF